MSLALMFPGQGSQSIGMLAQLAEAWPQVEETYQEASQTLGYDLWQLVQNGVAEELNQTDKTQPAMLAAGVAVWRVWQAAGGPAPQYMLGHSLGEYTALVCSGALEFTDAVGLVQKRGQLMQAAVPEGEGAMAAILGLSDDDVRAVCLEAAQGDVVQAVNFNSPGQVVIAGTKRAVERALPIAKEKGAKRALLLPVSVPSHCDLMMPAAESLAKELEDIQFHPANVSVTHNADVKVHQDGDAIRAALKAQLHQPVRWVECVASLAESGVDTIIECGPGKVLAGLNKRINKSMTAMPVFDEATLAKALDSTK